MIRKKLNAYSITGRRGLYGLFPSQFQHPTLNLPENPQVKYRHIIFIYYLINLFQFLLVLLNTSFLTFFFLQKPELYFYKRILFFFHRKFSIPIILDKKSFKNATGDCVELTLLCVTDAFLWICTFVLHWRICVELTSLFF